MEDNDVIVKRALEKYIDEQVNRNLQILRLKKEKDFSLNTKDISEQD